MLRPILILSLIVALGCGLVAFGGNGQPAVQQHAEAPASIIAKTISDMPPGTQATVHPETLVIDENKKVWLHKLHPIDEESPVIVHFLKDGTYEVELTDEKLRWIKVPLTDELKKMLVPVKAIHLPKKKQ